MKKRLLSVSAALFFVSSLAHAQSSQNFRIEIDVFDNGGLGRFSPQSQNFATTAITGQSAGLLNTGSQNFNVSSGVGLVFLLAAAPTAVEDAFSLPKVYALEQNYPNPFNPVTVIEYSLPRQSFVSLKIYDVLGRVAQTLVEERQEAGYYKAEFDATALSSGVYFYRLVGGSFVSTKKMLLLK